MFAPGFPSGIPIALSTLGRSVGFFLCLINVGVLKSRQQGWRVANSGGQQESTSGCEGTVSSDLSEGLLRAERVSTVRSRPGTSSPISWAPFPLTRNPTNKITCTAWMITGPAYNITHPRKATVSSFTLLCKFTWKIYYSRVAWSVISNVLTVPHFYHHLTLLRLLSNTMQTLADQMPDRRLKQHKEVKSLVLFNRALSGKQTNALKALFAD